MNYSHLLLCSFSLLLSLLIFLAVAYAGDVECVPYQRSSLLKLKAGFDFTFSDSELSSWQPYSNCCNWEGVTCDSESGMIAELDLSNINLGGKIDSSLFNLSSLRKLNLAFNNVNGSFIPDGFELLTNLTSLNLSNAGFYGQVPIGIAKLTSLVSLDLSNNEYSYSVYGNLNFLQLRSPSFGTLIQNLGNLQELYLDGVNISADGYQWSAELTRSTPKLRELSLRECLLTGPVHSRLLELHDLSVIRLDGNELNSTVPDFLEKFSSLNVIQLSDCQLHGILPASIFLLKNLTSVNLRHNPMLSVSLGDFADDSKLETLVLSGTNFHGLFPDSVLKLKSLIRLELSDCQLSGLIPSEIGNLSQLVYLNLSDNNFTGSLPSSIANLQYLTVLDLSNNSLSGQIPSSLFCLPTLQELTLNKNQLSGQLPELPNGTSGLETLDLSKNRLEGDISRLGALRNLSSLDLSYNKISVRDFTSNDSSSFPQLTWLALASCSLTTFPSFLRYQNHMHFLDLSNNKIAGAIPSRIWSIGWSGGYYLNLSRNLLTSVEQPLPHFNGTVELEQLAYVDLHSNLLSGPIVLPPRATKLLDYSNNFFSSIPSNFTSYLSSTVFLSLANNGLTGEIPTSICNATNLQILDFSENNLTGMIPLCLVEDNTALAVINLQGNLLHGRIPRNFSEGCRLNTINLNGNLLSGQLPASLVNCNKLERLNLGNNQLVDSFPFWLEKISTLRVLVLRSNKFHGQIDSSTQVKNFTFPMLQIFDISSNHFNGSLPSCILKNLRPMMEASALSYVVQVQYPSITEKSFYHDTVIVTSKGLDLKLEKIQTTCKTVDLSNNDFSGSIPEEVFGKFQFIRVLNLSHNALTGQIPSSFRVMKLLESLDLSQNHLSGVIPQDLASLTSLEFLNLSNNNLVGRVPGGNQLNTFSNSSFEGNPGLCGYPLSKQCSNKNANVDPSADSTEHDNSHSRYVIGLALSIGLGYGVGFAIAVFVQYDSWKGILAHFSEILMNIRAWVGDAAWKG